MKIALICVTYDSEHLYKMLASIYKSKTSYDYDIFLYDNNPKLHQDLYSISDNIARLNIIKSDTNKFWVGGVNYLLLNKIIPNRDYKYVFFLNDDIEVYNYFIDRHIDLLESNKSVGAVGGLNSCSKDWQYINRVSTQFKTVPMFENDEVNDIEHVNAVLNTLNPKPNPVIITGMLAFYATAFPVEVFRKVGVLDPRFAELMCGDDDDFCYRLQRQGYKLALINNIYTLHHGGASTNSIGKEELEKFNSRKLKASKLLLHKKSLSDGEINYYGN